MKKDQGDFLEGTPSHQTQEEARLVNEALGIQEFTCRLSGDIAILLEKEASQWGITPAMYIKRVLKHHLTNNV